MNDSSMAPNKMGTTPVFRLVLTMGAPMMLSMIVQALYNVVDSLFVSHIAGVGDGAVNALTLAFPIQMLILAFCVGTGVGVNASLSRSLGRQDHKTASTIAGNALLLSAVYYLAALIFGIFGASAYIRSQTANAQTAAMAREYLQIVTIYSFGSVFYMCFEKLLQATGKTTPAMLAQLAGAITNIILDPILIFGYLGFSPMGVRGAAIATVIGQCVSLVAALALHFAANKEIRIRPYMLKPNLPIIGKIYTVGGPAIVMQALTSVMTYGMNLILGSVSESAVTAYGVYYKLQSFIFMPAFGLNNASVPIISYNYGAKRPQRIRQATKVGLLIASVIMALGILIMQCFAPQVVSVFAISSASTGLCQLALRIISCGFLFVGVNIILQGVCQALGNGVYSLIISLLRMVVVALPAAWILIQISGKADVVWWAFPIAEAVACLAALLLTRSIYRQRVRPLEAEG